MHQLLVAVGIAAAAAVSAAPAYADPSPDPHMPNMQAGYCREAVWVADLSGLLRRRAIPRWLLLAHHPYGAPMIGHPYGLLSPGLQCVVGGGAIPQPAPPGGCAGAVPQPPPS